MIERVDDTTAAQAERESRWNLIQSAVNNLADAVFTIADAVRMKEADVVATIEGLQVVVLCKIVERASGPREAREELITVIANSIRDSTVAHVIKVLDEVEQQAQAEAAEAKAKGKIQ